MNNSTIKAEEKVKLADIGHYGLYAIKTNSGIWKYEGSVPEKLLIKHNGQFGEYWESPY